MATPLLWHFPISHFNEKVRWALDWKRIPHVRRTLGPGYLPRVWWATGRGTLPVLWLDGKAIGDSTRIIEVLEQRWPDPPLYPRDEAARRRALELEDFFDEELGHPLRAAILGPLLASDPEATVAVLTLHAGARPPDRARDLPGVPRLLPLPSRHQHRDGRGRKSEDDRSARSHRRRAP